MVLSCLLNHQSTRGAFCCKRQYLANKEKYLHFRELLLQPFRIVLVFFFSSLLPLDSRYSRLSPASLGPTLLNFKKTNVGYFLLYQMYKTNVKSSRITKVYIELLSKTSTVSVCQQPCYIICQSPKTERPTSINPGLDLGHPQAQGSQMSSDYGRNNIANLHINGFYRILLKCFKTLYPRHRPTQGGKEQVSNAKLCGKKVSLRYLNAYLEKFDVGYHLSQYLS